MHDLKRGEKGITDMISIIIPVFNTEKYLRDALNAIVAQTYKDYEVIIINDGSCDGSQQIINEFCNMDSRFLCYYQENSGVSAARNNGIIKAKGEFLFFYDSDDIILPDTLENLFNTAKDNDADMVIGRMEAVFIGETRVVKNSRVLSKKKEISKFDRNLLYSFTVNNKLFRADIIREYSLIFENFSFNEDGVFTFNYIKCCNKICGCNALVYKYRRRPYWDDNNSLTQQGTRALMEESMAALDRIKETVDELFAIEEKKLTSVNDEEDKAFTTEKQMYYSSMYYRFLNISVISNFYRLLWRGEDDLIDFINEKFNYFKARITSEYLLEALERNNPDIDLSIELPSKEEIIENPKICIVLSNNISKKNADRVIRGIYSQNMPSFVVYIDEKLSHNIDGEIKRKKNLFVIPKSLKGKELIQYVVAKCSSKYILLVDEDVYYESDAIKNMYSVLESDTSIQMVSSDIKAISKEKKDIDLMYYINKEKHDCFLGNKLFKTSLFKQKTFIYSLTGGNIKKIYDTCKYKRIDNSIYSSIKKKDVIIKSFSGLIRRHFCKR